MHITAPESFFAKIPAGLWPDHCPRGPRGAGKGEKVWKEFTIAAFGY